MSVLPVGPASDLAGSCGALTFDASGGVHAVGCSLFAQLFEAVPVGVVVVDLADRVVHANAEFDRVFGFPAARLQGQKLDSLVVPDFLEDEAGSLIRAVNGGETVTVDTLRRRNDGSLVDVTVRRVPLRAYGAIVGQLALFQELTQLRRAERAGAGEWITPDFEAPILELETDRHARLVATARDLFDTPVSGESRLAELARLLVPELADSCIVYLRDDDDHVRRLEVAFADPGQEELLREQLSNYPPELSPLIPPVERVLRSGEAELVPEVSLAALKAVPGDREHVSVALLVGLTSLLVVPVSGRGRVAAAISLAITDSERRFQVEDLLCLEEIARYASHLFE